MTPFNDPNPYQGVTVLREFAADGSAAVGMWDVSELALRDALARGVVRVEITRGNSMARTAEERVDVMLDMCERRRAFVEKRQAA